jgi:hypothetical protein
VRRRVEEVSGGRARAPRGNELHGCGPSGGRCDGELLHNVVLVVQVRHTVAATIRSFQMTL